MHAAAVHTPDAYSDFRAPGPAAGSGNKAPVSKVSKVSKVVGVELLLLLLSAACGLFAACM